jgi:dipeptidyl aminopeptidase/acylaminoacyl peptidase
MEGRMGLARELSPLTYARAGGPPTITIHGERDPVVPYTQAVRLHAALDSVGVPNRLITVRGAGHGGFDRETLVSSFVAIREFLRTNRILKKE